MKKMLFIILLLLIPFLTNAEECNPEKITLKYLGINDKATYVEEKSEPEIAGKMIDINIRMTEVGDYIEYKFSINNESTSDYELNKNMIKTGSNYIDYSFVTEEGNSIIKAGETVTAILKIEYKNEVQSNYFVNGVYKDNKNMLLNLSTEEVIDNMDNTKNSIAPDKEQVKNPNTKVGYIIALIITVLIISGIILVVLRNNKQNKYFVLIFVLLSIPVMVRAICQCEIEINSKVEITQKKNFMVVYKDCLSGETRHEFLYEFESGMSFIDYYKSAYYINLDDTRKEQLDDMFYRGLYDSDESFFNSGESITLLRAKEYDACMDAVSYPKYVAGMTPEEEEEYVREVKAARAAEDACYKTYTLTKYFADPIEDSEYGEYYKDMSYCPE